LIFPTAPAEDQAIKIFELYGKQPKRCCQQETSNSLGQIQLN